MACFLFVPLGMTRFRLRCFWCSGLFTLVAAACAPGDPALEIHARASEVADGGPAIAEEPAYQWPDAAPYDPFNYTDCPVWQDYTRSTEAAWPASQEPEVTGCDNSCTQLAGQFVPTNPVPLGRAESVMWLLPRDQQLAIYCAGVRGMMSATYTLCVEMHCSTCLDPVTLLEEPYGCTPGEVRQPDQLGWEVASNELTGPIRELYGDWSDTITPPPVDEIIQESVEEIYETIEEVEEALEEIWNYSTCADTVDACSYDKSLACAETDPVTGNCI